MVYFFLIWKYDLYIITAQTIYIIYLRIGLASKTFELLEVYMVVAFADCYLYIAQARDVLDVLAIDIQCIGIIYIRAESDVVLSEGLTVGHYGAGCE